VPLRSLQSGPSRPTPVAGDGLIKKDTISAVAGEDRWEAPAPDAGGRRQQLIDLYRATKGCSRCPALVANRRTVVFGAGNADAELMFVGEAPGATEDEQGLPFVGRAGQLLEQLLAEISLSRKEVFIANVLKCRPPANRDPLPTEVENCKPYLFRQVELVQPKVVCTLGNFATKLLRGSPQGITRVHGKVEVVRCGSRLVRLLPLYHPAAALRSPALVEVLREDFAQIPALLAEPDPGDDRRLLELETEQEEDRGPAQLGLF